MPSQFQISPWGANQQYRQYDIINGLLIGSTLHPTSSPLYATQDNVGQNPSGIFVYNVTSITSAEDVATVFFAQTGNVPNVAPGSVVKIQGTASNNYTGMAIGGQSGVLQFINPGFSDTAGAVGTVTMTNPAWSSGFFMVPTYGSKTPSQNTAIVTQLGGGYEQRMTQGLNTFQSEPVLVYQNIDRRMQKAIVHFVQDKAGVTPFEIMIPDAYWSNQPKHKYVATMAEPEPVSFQRWNCAVNLRRVFDV